MVNLDFSTARKPIAMILKQTMKMPSLMTSPQKRRESTSIRGVIGVYKSTLSIAQHWLPDELKNAHQNLKRKGEEKRLKKHQQILVLEKDQVNALLERHQQERPQPRLKRLDIIRRIQQWRPQTLEQKKSVKLVVRQDALSRAVS